MECLFSFFFVLVRQRSKVSVTKLLGTAQSWRRRTVFVTWTQVSTLIATATGPHGIKVWYSPLSCCAITGIAVLDHNFRQSQNQNKRSLRLKLKKGSKLPRSHPAITELSGSLHVGKGAFIVGVFDDV